VLGAEWKRLGAAKKAPFEAEAAKLKVSSLFLILVSFVNS
jgi:hypothetical protein